MEETDEYRDLIERAFQVPGFVELWPYIQSKYQEMGFKDHLTDREMIQEYKYISEQYRKFIFKRQDAIMAIADNPELVMDLVSDQISKLTESPTERKQLVYSAIRDEWLVSLYQISAIETMARNEKKEMEDVDVI